MQTPHTILGPLFVALQLAKVLDDDKAITDAILQKSPEVILAAYEQERVKDTFDLKTFFNQNFRMQPSLAEDFVSDPEVSVAAHIERLWPILTRKPGHDIGDISLLPLKYPYVVPGGRFNEIYYWDSYFTMLGLQASGKNDLIRHMVDNFAAMIRQYGHIPNGNRSYFLTRSQPPFFSLMVGLLCEVDGEGVYNEYLPQLIQEYAFWMDGSEEAQEIGKPVKHCVPVPGGMLNRYFDASTSPREEMYATDAEMLAYYTGDKEALMGHMRAACESGWDFSSRWLVNSKDLQSIRTCDIIPVDLNCLLAHLEYMIGRAIDVQGNAIMAQQYHKKSKARKSLIKELCKHGGYFYDIEIGSWKSTGIKSLAGMFPMYFNMIQREDVGSMVAILEEEFLKDGGLVTTPIVSGQQWDAPNGWAPLQYMAVKALLNYKQYDLAHDIMKRWIGLNDKVFAQTGKMLEKYNVVDVNLLSGGGEYPVQDGFGWTNGVYMWMDMVMKT